MIHQKVLLDTGPLVAFLNKRDQYHSWTVSELASMAPTLLTCEAVLSESCFLLQRLMPTIWELVFNLFTKN